MAEATGSVPAPLHPGIPDEIAVWEILIRLPPKDVLRCRAVCPAWRRATSTRDFLLAHHVRQPSLPIVSGRGELISGSEYEGFLAFDHRGNADAKLLQPVTRLDGSFNLEASCDGLLIHFDRIRLSICNPATRQYAPLMQLYDFRVMGMYRHSPTGEYRLLLGKLRDLPRLPPDGQDGTYVFTLGSVLPPRHIGYSEAEEVIHTSSVLFGGNLHWHIDQHLSNSGSNLIMVFDTTTELFWQMHAPAVSGNADLFEMGDMLGMASFDTIIDIWVMQDYQSQVWAFKCRIELPVEELRMEYHNLQKVVVMPGDGELSVLVKTEDRLYHVDINGKLISSFLRTGLRPTEFRLKQTLVMHTFFPTLEGYVVNASPFISQLLS